MKQSPAETAKTLMKEGFTIERYESVQKVRRERLAFWEKRGEPVKMMAEKERKLIEFGERVLVHMRANANSN